MTLIHVFGIIVKRKTSAAAYAEINRNFLLRRTMYCWRLLHWFVCSLPSQKITAFCHLKRRIHCTIKTMDVLTDIQSKSGQLHPKHDEKFLEYGTAGFRTKAIDLPHVVFRMGQLSALRSKAKNGSYIGVMITASHNPEEDNGVKLCDPKGEMLEHDWEVVATQLANAPNDGLASILEKLISDNNINMESAANIILAYDTRESSLGLAKALTDGARLLNANVKNFGLLSTPQLHYVVHCTNSGGAYGEPTEDGYYTKLGSAFFKLCQQHAISGGYTDTIKLDGANGVGALQVKKLLPYLKGQVKIEICNNGAPGRLNHLCGADYVKIEQEAPKGLQYGPGDRCASLDGDADRIIYFYNDKNNVFHMLDGDKISALVTGFIQELVKKIGLDLELCAVQTAYANGSSTRYINKNLNVPVACVPTGVKHLHHRAQEADIGIYFEANGHGTVVLGDTAIQKIKDAAINKSDIESSKAANTLLNVIDIINQTVGDAISDMLLVEVVLRSRGWSIAHWDALYQDLPNRQLKVKVSDRTLVTTTDAERRCLTPARLQEEMDALTTGKPNWRAFVRPSGTEDIVRVYAEADTQHEADNLAYEVSLRVHRLAGGVGPEPNKP